MLNILLHTFTITLILSLLPTTSTQDTTQPWKNWPASSLDDRTSIQQTLALYAIAVDTKTWSLFTEVFTIGANATYDATTPVLTGLPQIQAYLEASVAGKTSQHLLGTQLIAVAGDSLCANATTYVQATLGVDPRLSVGQVVMLYGFYNDRMIKVDGGWRIESRVFRLYGPEMAGNVSVIAA